jgi:hypothetical protein
MEQILELAALDLQLEQQAAWSRLSGGVFRPVLSVSAG